MGYSLVLRGGTLVDPAQGIFGIKDIVFKDGTVDSVDDELSISGSVEELDCKDMFVSPGFIDLHVHVYYGVGQFGIAPDPVCISKGVTTALDAGTAGADTFKGFKKYIIEKSDTRLFAYLNISSQGLLTPNIGEFENIGYANPLKAIEIIETNQDVILGVKVRLSKECVNSKANLKPLYIAREVADIKKMPIMVHPQDAYCDSIDNILSVLQKNDILTHCFHPEKCGILDDSGKIRQSVWEARERGVIFDIGHGGGSFSWKVAEKALLNGFEPNTISSDLHAYNINGPVYDLPTTLSKFFCLGLSLENIIACATLRPAQALNMSNQIGSLKEGTMGDAVVFKLEEGNFDFSDTNGQHRIGRKRIVPAAVIRDGKVYKRAFLS